MTSDTRLVDQINTARDEFREKSRDLRIDDNSRRGYSLAADLLHRAVAQSLALTPPKVGSGELDAAGLEAAHLAAFKVRTGEVDDDEINAAIRAYLAAPVDHPEVVGVTGDAPSEDRAENIIDNPKSWIAWKREAEKHQATIDEMWVQFDRLRDATNRPKCGQAFMVGGHHIAPWGIVDHAISALDLSMMRADRIDHEQSECEKLRARLAALQPSDSPALEAGVAKEPIAWRHRIVEPTGETHVLLSHSADNPWSHWLEMHRAECQYTVTPLYASAALSTPAKEAENPSFECTYCHAWFDDPTTLCGLEKCDFKPIPAKEDGK